MLALLQEAINNSIFYCQFIFNLARFGPSLRSCHCLVFITALFCKQLVQLHSTLRDICSWFLLVMERWGLNRSYRQVRGFLLVFGIVLHSHWSSHLSQRKLTYLKLHLLVLGLARVVKSPSSFFLLSNAYQDHKRHFFGGNFYLTSGWPMCKNL